MKFARVGENNYAFYRPVYHDITILAGGLNIIYSGVCMGQLFGGKLRPDHALALFADLRRETGTETNGLAGGAVADVRMAGGAVAGGAVAGGAVAGGAVAGGAVAGGAVAGGLANLASLSLDEALDYLRKREFNDPSRLAEGLNLLTCSAEGLPPGGLPIGWTKRIGHRTNTMLPNSFRIVNL
jgi:hypothetical protein